MSLTDKRCKKCVYASKIPSTGLYACMYIVHEEQKRGCPAGAKCTKFVKGANIKLKGDGFK